MKEKLFSYFVLFVCLFSLTLGFISLNQSKKAFKASQRAIKRTDPIVYHGYIKAKDYIGRDHDEFIHFYYQTEP